MEQAPWTTIFYLNRCLEALEGRGLKPEAKAQIVSAMVIASSLDYLAGVISNLSDDA